MEEIKEYWWLIAFLAPIAWRLVEDYFKVRELSATVKELKASEAEAATSKSKAFERIGNLETRCANLEGENRLIKKEQEKLETAQNSADKHFVQVISELKITLGSLETAIGHMDKTMKALVEDIREVRKTKQIETK